MADHSGYNGPHPAPGNSPLATTGGSVVRGQAATKDWPDTQGWTVGEAGEDACGIRMEYEGKGESRLTYLKYLDGSKFFVIENYSWSAESNKRYNIGFIIDGQSLVTKNFAAGSVDGIYKGFVQLINDEIFRHFVKGSSLRIYMFPEISGNDPAEESFGEPFLIDQLSLSGSGPAVAQLDRCLSHVRTVSNAARREKERFDHLPDDPFKR